MTLGSLFDGSGGFPLAGALAGIEPVWAAEVEPYPIAVTRSRFPMMQHLGSVTEVHGDKVQPVDVITFGSPCQDLSVAGKRAGIHDGQRSNLFFEAIRIIKEMREATNGRYPAFAVWENVPGAFSSNRGEDFRCVLEELAQIAGGEVSIPRPAGGKWHHAGEIVGDGYSIAWRVLDAQYWGVPQRRKRIYLVADFAGERAGKILFERDGMRGHPAPGRATGQGAAADAPGSTGGSRGIECLNPWDYQNKRIYQPEGVYPTLTAMNGGSANNQAIIYALDSMPSNSMKSSNPRSGFHEETVAKTLQAGGVDPTCNQGGNVIVEPVYALQGDGKPPRRYIIRRLTPLECNRLQGFPDGWGIHDHKDSLTGEEFVFWMNVYMTYARINGKKPRAHTAKSLTQWYNRLHTDSAEYKMWGNGIALPCAEYVMEGIAEELKEAAQCTKA